MAINVTSPVTGAAQSGLTTPGYVITADSNVPKIGAKQYVVVSLTGTQTGVNSHTASLPFTLSVEGPSSYAQAPVTGPYGLTKPVGTNRYVIRTRKGGAVTSINDRRIALIETVILVPAGMDLYGSAELRAALSLHIGALNQQSPGIGDTGVTGTL